MTPNEFIESQQKLAAEMFYGPINVDLKELVTDIIKNTGEELKRRYEEEASPYRPNDKEFYNDTHRECGYRHAIDTLKKHITSITGVE